MRFILCIALLIFFQFLFPATGHASPSVSANNAILIEQSTGRVLFEKNAYEEESIASITKIMTAVLAVESGKMKEEATASRNAIYTEGSSIYLEQGEKMTIEDLVYGLMLRSGNDAAVAIAEHIGGSEEGFVFLMNEKAKWLGMENTHFDNPHGLDSDSHYSSAYDMAKLMSYAMENEEFRKITGTDSYKSDQRSYSWQNKNKLLTQYYDHSTGGKTGFTKKTGRTLVSSASKDGLDLIAVTLNAPDDWQDHIKMYEWGFENYDMERIAKKGSVSYQLVSSNELKTGYIHQDILFPLTDEEKLQLDHKNFLLTGKEETGSTIIGKTVFYLEGESVTETYIHNESKENDFFTSFLLTLKKVIGM